MKPRMIFNSLKAKIDKNSPEILVIAGVAGMIGATVLACRATIKAKAVKEDTKAQLDMIDCCEKDGKTIDDNNEQVEYTPEDAKRDRKTIKVKAWVMYGKIFAPAVIVGSVSIAAVLFGHNILRKRYVSLGSAYTALDKAYTEYRHRVADKYGEDAEKEIRYGYGAADKPKKKDEVDAKPLSPNEKLKCSPYAKFFDSSSKFWEKNAENNLWFLRSQQATWNEILHAKGRVTLNDIYSALGLEPTAAGQTIGWVFDRDHPDTYIDFGIYDITKPKNRAFVDGYENVILLDFNVTGDIRKSFGMEI